MCQHSGNIDDRHGIQRVKICILRVCDRKYNIEIYNLCERYGVCYLFLIDFICMSIDKIKNKFAECNPISRVLQFYLTKKLTLTYILPIYSTTS